MTNYSMMLYDIYGNCYHTPTVTFSCDENGELFFNPEDLQ